MKRKRGGKKTTSLGAPSRKQKQKTAPHLVSRSEIRNLFKFLRLCKKVDNKSSQPFKGASISDINNIVKIIRLVLRDRLPIKKDKLKQLKKYKTVFRKLIRGKSNPLKRRLINQSGSGILSLIPIIGTVLSSLLGK